MNNFKTEPKYYPIELFHWAGMTDANLIELIDVLTECPEYINEKNSTNDNCLLIAARSGNVGMVKYLIENTGIDLQYRHPQDGNVLLAAAMEYKKNVIDYLLTVDEIDLHLRNNKGLTIYHYLAKYGADVLFEKLLERDIEKKSNMLDGAGRHCLFNCIENYNNHKNYWCFEVIQESLSLEDLMIKDNEGLNVFEFLEIKNNKVLKSNDYSFEPLIPVLNARGLWSQLDFELEKKDIVDCKKNIKI